MNALEKLQKISQRLDKIDQSGEWLGECLEDSDPALADAAALISSLAEDVQVRLIELIRLVEAGHPLLGNVLGIDGENEELH